MKFIQYDANIQPKGAGWVKINDVLSAFEEYLIIKQYKCKKGWELHEQYDQNLIRIVLCIHLYNV